MILKIIENIQKRKIQDTNEFCFCRFYLLKFTILEIKPNKSLKMFIISFKNNKSIEY